MYYSIGTKFSTAVCLMLPEVVNLNLDKFSMLVGLNSCPVCSDAVSEGTRRQGCTGKPMYNVLQLYMHIEVQLSRNIQLCKHVRPHAQALVV